MRSNCIVFALALYFRRRHARQRLGRTGYLLIRRSRLAMSSPHLPYAESRPGGGLRVVSYVPRHPETKLCPPPLFRGVPKWGDE